MIGHVKGKYIKAEKKHYEKWVAKDASNLIETLLMLEGIYPTTDDKDSNLELFNNFVKKETLFGMALDFPFNSRFINRISLVVNMITSKRIPMVGTTRILGIFVIQDYFENCFLECFKDDSKILLDVIVKPSEVLQCLLEHRESQLNDIRRNFVPHLDELIGFSPEESQKELEFDPEKPIDSRAVDTKNVIICGFMEKHYKYDPKAKKNMDTSKVMKLIEMLGLKRSHSAVKRHLDDAYQTVQEELDRI